MKIIDLLVKIAKGEGVPKKIRIAGWCYKFEWVEHDENYYDKNADIDLMSCLSMCEDELNREVEIIEEPKEVKLPEKLMQLDTREKQGCIIKTQAKINEIIDYLKAKEEREDKE